MSRNRYNYLTPSVQDTKGEEGRTYSNGTTIKTLQAETHREDLLAFAMILHYTNMKFKILLKITY